jgi:hypothetical protein
MGFDPLWRGAGADARRRGDNARKKARPGRKVKPGSGGAERLNIRQTGLS